MTRVEAPSIRSPRRVAPRLLRNTCLHVGRRQRRRLQRGRRIRRPHRVGPRPGRRPPECGGVAARRLYSPLQRACLAAAPVTPRSHPPVHTQLVATLRRCALRGRLHDARVAMSLRFPLSEKLWREWLDDETEAASRCSPLRVAVSSSLSLTHSLDTAPRILTAYGRCTRRRWPTSCPCRCGVRTSRCASLKWWCPPPTV